MDFFLKLVTVREVYWTKYLKQTAFYSKSYCNPSDNSLLFLWMFLVVVVFSKLDQDITIHSSESLSLGQQSFLAGNIACILVL